MERLLAGLVVGFAAAIFTLVYVWVGEHPHTQALMIFVGILSAVRAVSSSRTEHHKEIEHE
jgi:hypothetical protein